MIYSASRPMGPQWLLAQMRLIHGSNLAALGEGEGITTSGGNVTGWAALAGPNLTAAGTGSYAKARNNGRYGISGPTNTGKRLTGTLGSPYKAIAVATHAPTLPFSRSTIAFDGNANTQVYGLSGGSTFYTDANRTSYVNGIVSNTVASGFQVIAVALPTGTDTVMYLGGYHTGGYDWCAAIEAYACFTDVPSAAQVLATSKLLHAYARK